MHNAKGENRHSICETYKIKKQAQYLWNVHDNKQTQYLWNVHYCAVYETKPSRAIMSLCIWKLIVTAYPENNTQIVNECGH